MPCSSQLVWVKVRCLECLSSVASLLSIAIADMLTGHLLCARRYSQYLEDMAEQPLSAPPAPKPPVPCYISLVKFTSLDWTGLFSYLSPHD